MPARSKAARLALGIDGQHIGVAVQHPARRGGGGGAQHHLQPLRAQGCNGAVEPAPIVLARLRLHPAPREFADAHPCQADFGHAGCIAGPDGVIPVFRIITNPKPALHSATKSSTSPLATPSKAKTLPECGKAAFAASDISSSAVVTNKVSIAAPPKAGQEVWGASTFTSRR